MSWPVGWTPENPAWRRATSTELEEWLHSKGFSTYWARRNWYWVPTYIQRAWRESE